MASDPVGFRSSATDYFDCNRCTLYLKWIKIKAMTVKLSTKQKDN